MGKIIKSGIDYAGGGGGGSDINVVQTVGESTADVMSQAAVSKMIHPVIDNNLSVKDVFIGPDTYSGWFGAVRIGDGKRGSGGGSVSIGYDTYVAGDHSISIGSKSESTNGAIALGVSAACSSANDIAIGVRAKATHNNSIALGPLSATTRDYELNVRYNDGNRSRDRIIGGVADGENDNDVATVGQLNTAIDGIEVPTVVQTTGDSTTDVMSQKAATKLIYAERTGTGIDDKVIQIGSNATIGPEGSAGTLKIGIGKSLTVSGNNSIAIGNRATSIGGDECIVIGTDSSTGQGDNNAVAIGSRSKARSQSVALGADSLATDSFEVSIGSRKAGEAFDRRLSCVKDGTHQNDAATVRQGNKIVNHTPTTTSEGVLGQLWTDTSDMRAVHTYQCTAIDTTDPDNPVYTWTQRW